jgi:hypothetical protein
MLKSCSRCKEEKDTSCFGVRSGNLLLGRCKTCMKIESKIFRDKNREKIRRSGRERSRKQYAEKTKECLEKQKEWKAKNPDKVKGYRKKHYDKEWHRVYRRNRYTNEPEFKLIDCLRSRIGKALKRKQVKTIDLLGCSMKELRIYLESKFQEGMSWDNHGSWHIDHTIPLSSGKTGEEIKKLCHHTNLQPLWAKENLRKGNKVTTSACDTIPK